MGRSMVNCEEITVTIRGSGQGLSPRHQLVRSVQVVRVVTDVWFGNLIKFGRNPEGQRAGSAVICSVFTSAEFFGHTPFRVERWPGQNASFAKGGKARPRRRGRGDAASAV